MGQVVGPLVPMNCLVAVVYALTSFTWSLGLPSNGHGGMDSLGVRLVSCKLFEHTPSSFIFGTTFRAMLPFLHQFLSLP